ncbi:hypothetical protein GCM10027590_53270 [Nocardiopsis nanhaiensis]
MPLPTVFFRDPVRAPYAQGPHPSLSDTPEYPPAPCVPRARAVKAVLGHPCDGRCPGSPWGTGPPTGPRDTQRAKGGSGPPAAAQTDDREPDDRNR